MSDNDPKPAVFIDRDKTLIADPGYIRSPEQVRLLDGVTQALARLREAGYPVIVVTNQSGVARGLLTEADLAAIHQRLQDLLRAEGSGVDAIYHCPFLDGPEAVCEAFRRDSALRKPKPGMLHLAAQERGIDLGRSWMIGDSERDVQAGRAAGCQTVLINAGIAGASTCADFIAADLKSAVDIVLGQADSGDVAKDPRHGEETRDDACERSAGESRPKMTQQAEQAPPAKTKAETDAWHLEAILDELRAIRRERQYEDFSIGKLAGAIAQAFAACAFGWGLYAAANGDASAATIRLLAGIGFQLMALTWFTAARK